MPKPSLSVLFASALAAFACAGVIAVGNDERLIDLAAAKRHAAATFFVESVTIEGLQRIYRGMPMQALFTPSYGSTPQKVRILIVPGHEPHDGGTMFADVYERDAVVDIANTLAGYLAHNARYTVKIARTKAAWDPELAAYFGANEAAIQAFRAAQALEMAKHIAAGRITLPENPIDHLSTPTAGAIKLYGINKWAGENKYDIVLHLHLNDYGGRPQGRAGVHDGFAMYVPDAQYSNAKASRAVGEAIAYRLAAYHSPSSLPKESEGIIPDQQLIALGANNSADNAAVLIEYGYIYEPQLQDPFVRGIALADYAYATYLGLQDFFNDPIETSGSVAALLQVPATLPQASGRATYELQATLRARGYYPPPGSTLRDCPVSGVLGPCTKAAIESYRRANPQ